MVNADSGGSVARAAPGLLALPTPYSRPIARSPLLRSSHTSDPIILDLTHSLEGISLSPSHFGEEQPQDPAATVRVRLATLPNERFGCAYLNRSRIFHYVGCDRLKGSTSVAHTGQGGVLPPGRRLALCCIGAGLIGAHYAAGVVF